MSYYRCGWCGQPTDETGVVLTMSQIGLASNRTDWDGAQPVNGHCCPHGDQAEQERRDAITREMALDAGDPDLEGQDW